jgi:lactoylglutathione lyase
MFKRIDHVAIHVADLNRSVTFYEKHFGFKHYFQQTATGGSQIAYLKLADTVLELTHHSDGEMKGFHFCLETDNFDDSVAKLQADGVVLIRAPHNTAAREPREQGWRRVVFGGPDGEQIELRG